MGWMSSFRASGARWFALAGMVSSLLSGCAPAAQPSKSVSAAASSSAPLKRPFPMAPILVEKVAPAGAVTSPASTATVPILEDDAQLGDPEAPVSIVVFSDFQCPFCSRVVPTLKQIADTYGERVRWAFKHNPLPFHNRARPAAEAARVVLALGGNQAFYGFHDRAFANQQQLTDENFEKWAAEVGVDKAAFKRAYESHAQEKRVEDDIKLAAQVGAKGTPAFRINGVTVSGAQPFDKFKKVIDEQLEEARKLREQGVNAGDVYTLLTNKNQPKSDEAKARAEEDEEDKTVWKVPVLADDPVLGASDAPVTVVVFSDFQCPFCKRVEETLTKLRDTYGAKLRFVWKDHPLPFHPRAVPAAVLARVAFTRQGNAGFWRAHDALFESQPKLEDTDLEGLSKRLGLDWKAVKAAIEQKRFQARFEDSIGLANDFQARGTPHFFINGVRLSGAQPVESFKALIDRRLAEAEKLVAAGVPRKNVYAESIKDGKLPPPPETKEVAPRANAPYRGGAQAKVVIQEFGDFQCPFSSRVQPTLEELQKQFGAKIKIVYRHMPLPFHKDAPLAAEAAEEAFAQKGNAGFWAFHDALFKSAPELERADLEKIAEEQHLDMARFRSALDSRLHSARVNEDTGVANKAGINGTPAFLINGYFLSGAQPLTEFVKLVQRALKEAK
ncbi:MAG: thioredoxin domain-containing protein [Polyangiaceae bacterium]